MALARGEEECCGWVCFRGLKNQNKTKPRPTRQTPPMQSQEKAAIPAGSAPHPALNPECDE